jgi:hypothetical protein
MKTMKCICLSIVPIFLVLLGGAAFAQQSTAPTITLNVPLQFTDLHPDVALISVQGSAYDNAGASHPCATGKVEMQCPPSGAVNQTVSVVLTQLQGLDITKATSYSATFSIYLKNGNFSPPRRPVPSNTGPRRERRSRLLSADRSSFDADEKR